MISPSRVLRPLFFPLKAGPGERIFLPPPEIRVQFLAPLFVSGYRVGHRSSSTFIPPLPLQAVIDFFPEEPLITAAIEPRFFFFSPRDFAYLPLLFSPD